MQVHYPYLSIYLSNSLSYIYIYIYMGECIFICNIYKLLCVLSRSLYSNKLFITRTLFIHHDAQSLLKFTFFPNVKSMFTQ